MNETGTLIKHKTADYASLDVADVASGSCYILNITAGNTVLLKKVYIQH